MHTFAQIARVLFRAMVASFVINLEDGSSATEEKMWDFIALVRGSSLATEGDGHKDKEGNKLHDRKDANSVFSFFDTGLENLPRHVCLFVVGLVEQTE